MSRTRPAHSSLAAVGAAALMLWSAASAQAAISSQPPVPLPSTTAPAQTAGSLPRTGADLPLELAAASLLLAGGIGLRELAHR